MGVRAMVLLGALASVVPSARSRAFWTTAD
jgi:hypothetical protein